MKNLPWGLHGQIPDSAGAAWGARTILRCGMIDIVPDRRGIECFDEKEHLLFIRWLHDIALPWINAKAKSIYGDHTDIHEFDDGKFHLRASANASHGYLYITCWEDS